MSTPSTTRSGFMKSSTAAPSFRNSGLLHMWNGSFAFLRDRARDLRRRADGHRRLGDDDHLARHVLADRLGDGEHVPQVGRAVFVRRRADGDEHDLGARDRGADVGRELEAALRLVALDAARRARARRSAGRSASGRRSCARRRPRRRRRCPSPRDTRRRRGRRSRFRRL